MSLVVNSVSKHFAGLIALEDVSFRLDQEEILGVIGPNGSGKTTLVNVTTGLLDPDGGTVQVDGRDMTGVAPDAIARAGVVRTFQTVRLFGGLSVWDNVAAVIRDPDRPIDEVVDEHLERLGLGHLGSTPSSHLAYGLQRRLEIARALATRPRYLLLDEPAAGLNDVESADLEETIRAIPHDPRWGCGVLIIDHDLRLITSLCDRLLVMASGKVIAEGPPEEVRHQPQVVEAYIGRRKEKPR